MCQCVNSGKNKPKALFRPIKITFYVQFPSFEQALTLDTLKLARCNLKFLLSISVSWLSFNMALNPNHQNPGTNTRNQTQARLSSKPD